MMKKIILSFTAVLFLFYLNACSTVINTTTQQIELKTTPPNAKIVIDGKKFGTSPQVVNIDRGMNHVIKFELDGYEVYEIQLTRQISNWYYLNILNGLIPGMVLDWLNGSMYNLFPYSIDVELTQAKVEEPKKRR